LTRVNIRTKMIIIIVLKLDSRVNIRIKIIIIIVVLKLVSGVNQGKTQVTSWESQQKLTRVNIWIQMIIIIVLKPNLGVDLR
jgi:hypothetical protein